MATAQQTSSPMTSKEAAETKASINKKVNKAIQLLNEAGSEQVKYTSDNISEKITQTKEQALELKNQMSTRMSQYTEKAEKRIQENPFYFLAGFAVLGALFGFMMGRRR